MVDLIANAPNNAALAAAGAAMGFWDAKNKQVITNGPIQGGGSWFYNYAGVVYVPTGATTLDEQGNTVPAMSALPGVWVRVRHNGDPKWLPTLPANSGITLYSLVTNGETSFWSSDGVTPAPDYVGTIAAIA